MVLIARRALRVLQLQRRHVSSAVGIVAAAASARAAGRWLAWWLAGAAALGGWWLVAGWLAVLGTGCTAVYCVYYSCIFQSVLA